MNTEIPIAVGRQAAFPHSRAVRRLRSDHYHQIAGQLATSRLPVGNDPYVPSIGDPSDPHPSIIRKHNLVGVEIPRARKFDL